MENGIRYTRDENKKYLSDYPMPSRYAYAELRAAAVRCNATIADRMMLLKFMWHYSSDSSWNGEYYDIDDGKRLYPIDEPVAYDDGEPFEWEPYDAEII